MVIDVHVHALFSEYEDVASRLGMGATRISSQARAAMRSSAARVPPDMATRLALMDDAGVERQILSLTNGPYSASLQDAEVAARLGNDQFARLCREHPARLAFWASLPLPHVKASIAEVGRAIDELGAVGVTLQCSCLDETIARTEFDPLYDELNRRKAIVFFHHVQNGLCSPLINDFGLTVCAGASMEDAVAAMHLIAKQVPARFPDIRFIVPHLGGILPMLLERLDGQMPREGFTEAPSETARRFYYDTVSWGSEAALLAAVTAFGASQLVTGSDFPVVLGWESYRQTFDHIRHANLPQLAVDRILNHNAAQLLSP